MRVLGWYVAVQASKDALGDSVLNMEVCESSRLFDNITEQSSCGFNNHAEYDLDNSYKKCSK